MEYILYFIILFFAIMGILVFLRKLQYDRTHVNLLNLVDEIGGRVVRKSFANQPVFQGNFNSKVVQISFSSDRLENKRQDYITYSINYQTESSVTITSLNWLRAMGEDAEESDTVIILADRFSIRTKSKELMKKFETNPEILQDLLELDHLAYLMFSPDGLLSEQMSNDYNSDTETKTIINRLKVFDRIYLNLIKS